MTQPVGPPAPPNIQNIAERAERIVKRAEANTKDEAIVSGEGQKKTLRAQAERLPENYQDNPKPQKIEGRVIAVEGKTLKIETASGTIEVKTDYPPEVKTGQRVVVELPPGSRIGESLQISYTPVAEIELPPEINLPPSRSTAEFPPVKTNDIVLATPLPISDYTAFVSGAPVATPAHYSPAELIAFAERLPETLSSAARSATLTPRLQSVIQAYDLGGLPLENIIKAPPVHRPIVTETFSVHSSMPDIDASDNVLTQAPLKSPDVQGEKTSQKFSTNLIAALAEIEQPLVSKKINPFTADGEAQSKVLRSFKQINVMAVIAPETPQAQLKPLASEALSKSVKQNKTSPMPQGEIVLAHVAGATKDGQTILSLPPAKDSSQSEPRLLYIQSQIFAQEGGQILLNLSEVPISDVATSQEIFTLPKNLQGKILQGAATAPITQAGLLPPPMNQPAFAQTWPVMQQVLDTLTQQAPQVAQNLQNTLPSPSPRMVSTALFFIAALKLGNLENWLGNKTLDAIESTGKKGLIGRLAGDFGRLSAQATEQSSGQWKTLTLPMLFEGEISNIQLHVKSDDHAKDNNKNDEIEETKKTRFVLDLTLSQMGPMQLDGFLTPKTLDMILRNQQRLAESNRQELMKIFSNTLELTGLKGSLSFQNKPEQWVRVSQA